MPRNTNSPLTRERLRELLDYNPETGFFTWRVNRSTNIKAGAIAGSTRSDGYVTVAINNVRYLTHRLAWMYTHGSWPEHLIDHVNENPSDNRLCNLRPANKSENGCNKGPRVDSKSGVKNVMWQKRQGGWYIQLKIHGEKYFYGYFKDLELAALVAEEAREKIHGVFANHRGTCNA